MSADNSSKIEHISNTWKVAKKVHNGICRYTIIEDMNLLRRVIPIMGNHIIIGKM